MMWGRRGVVVVAACLMVFPAVTECQTRTATCEVGWPEVTGAKLYELHFGPQNGTEHGSQTAVSNSTTVTQLLPDTTYEFRVRASLVNEVSGWLDWEPYGFTCTSTSQVQDDVHSPVAASASSESKFLVVYRVSELQLEGQSEVDFLSNHDVGTAAGDVAFLTAACGGTGGHFTHSFNESIVTQYCVEYASPNTADYLACNAPHTAVNATDDSIASLTAPMPNMTYTCVCNNMFDRRVAHMNVTGVCKGEVCHCANESLAYSKFNVGELQVYLPWVCGGLSGDGTCDTNIPFGNWYSLPVDGQCAEDEEIGSNGCTWKRHPRADFLFGTSFLEHGWNMTKPDWSSRNTAQYVANLASFKEAFAEITSEQFCAKAASLL